MADLGSNNGIIGNVILKNASYIVLCPLPYASSKITHLLLPFCLGVAVITVPFPLTIGGVPPLA